MLANSTESSFIFAVQPPLLSDPVTLLNSVPELKSWDNTVKPDHIKNEWDCVLVTKNSLSTFPNNFWLHGLCWHPVHAHTIPFVFSIRYTVSKRAHKGVASVTADRAVLNYAV